MTTIAWDGLTLAADRRISTDSQEAFRARKLADVGGAWVAVAGPIGLCRAFERWIRALDVSPMPAALARAFDAGEVEALVVDCASGQVSVYSGSDLPTEVEGHAAIGSGWQFAKAALELGRTAGDAVRLAMRLDGATGGEVDEVRVLRRRRKAVR